MEVVVKVWIDGEEMDLAPKLKGMIMESFTASQRRSRKHPLPPETAPCAACGHTRLNHPNVDCETFSEKKPIDKTGGIDA